MDRNLDDIDSLSTVRYALGGPVGEPASTQATEIDGPLSMAQGGLVDIDSLSAVGFEKGGEAFNEKQDDFVSPENQEDTRKKAQEMLYNLRASFGPIVGQFVPGIDGVDVRASVPVGPVRTYVDVNPNQRAITQVGATYGNIGPQGGYEVGLSKRAPIETPAGKMDMPVVAQGTYRVPVGKMGEVSAQGFYAPRQGQMQQAAYGANVRYAQRFEKGGEVDEEAYTDAEIARMRQALQQAQMQPQEQQSPMRQSVRRRASRPADQESQRPMLARQQLYALPPYTLDLAGKLGRTGPLKMQSGGLVSPQQVFDPTVNAYRIETPAETAARANKVLNTAISTDSGGAQGSVSGPTGFGQGVSSAAQALGIGLASYGQLGVAPGAIAASVLGNAVMGQQADAMANAAAAAQQANALGEFGIGTFSDMEGNIGTFSSPATVTAADVATFGISPDAPSTDEGTTSSDEGTTSSDEGTTGDEGTSSEGSSTGEGSDGSSSDGSSGDGSSGDGSGGDGGFKLGGEVTKFIKRKSGSPPQGEEKAELPEELNLDELIRMNSYPIRYPGQSAPLPSDLATAANKEIQDLRVKQNAAWMLRNLPQPINPILQSLRNILTQRPPPPSVHEVFGIPETEDVVFEPTFKKSGETVNRQFGSPPEGEVAEQMTVGTLPTDQEPGPMGQVVRTGARQMLENLRQAAVEPAAFHKRALGNIAQQLQENPEEFAMNWTGGGLGGIIRPKGGGNLLSGEVEKAIKPLRRTVRVGSGETKFSSDFLAEMKKVGPDEAPVLAPGLLPDIERSAALDDWIKNKFGNYVKKQMGTEDDPIRKLADEMDAKIKEDYQAGLKRIAKMKEDIARAKLRGKNTDASEQALADETERVEEAFASTSALPVRTGPYASINARVGEAREKAGFSPYPIATSMEARAYEELADMPFVPMTKRELDEKILSTSPLERSSRMELDPWLSKLKDEDIVYGIRDYDVNEKQIFIHVIDELKNSLNPNSGLPNNLLLKPEDMQQLGIEKAFRHVNKINDWRAQQRISGNLEEANRSAVTVKEYLDSPRKLKWQELKPTKYTELPPGYTIRSNLSGESVLFDPKGERLTTLQNSIPWGRGITPEQQALDFLSKNDLERALKYEGSTMRHCVGGYCDDVWSGQTNIFSLRDRKGEPHVTIETAPPDIRRSGNRPTDFLDSMPSEQLTAYTNKNGITPEELDDVFSSSATAGGRSATIKVIKSPEFQEWIKSKPSEILQIKGKGNAKPKEEYIPFVQDFIKSQQWSHIGDINNADLVPLKNEMFNSLKKKGIDMDVFYLDEASRPHVTKQEFNRLADLVGGMNKYPE